MKANELMIGDWVICAHTTIERPVKVIEVLPENIGYNSGSIGVLHTNFIEPILLTEKILVKNDFIHDGTIIDYAGINVKSFSYNNGEVWGYLDGLSFEIGFHGENPIFKLYYVHQLQHALRLCGIDKTIEL